MFICNSATLQKATYIESKIWTEFKLDCNYQEERKFKTKETWFLKGNDVKV